MARSEKFYLFSLIYLIALAQGVTWEIVPALSQFLTNKQCANFTEIQYGSLSFILKIGAIVASIFNGFFSRKIGLHRTILFGVFFNFISMIFFTVGNFYLQFFLIFLASLFLGLGVGTLLMSLGVTILLFSNEKKSAALILFYAFLGMGSTFAPIYINFDVVFCNWWINSAILAAVFLIFLFLVLINYSIKNISKSEMRTNIKSYKFMFSPKVWVVITIAILYGIYEVTFSSWGALYLSEVKGFAFQQSNLGLASYWGAFTIGQIVFAGISYLIPGHYIYPVLPVLMFLAQLILLNSNVVSFSLFFFGSLGFACSAFYPLTVRFATRKFPKLEEELYGTTLGSYFIGAALGTYAIGFLIDDLHIDLNTLYQTLLVLPVLFLIYSFISVRKKFN